MTQREVDRVVKMLNLILVCLVENEIRKNNIQCIKESCYLDGNQNIVYLINV